MKSALALLPLILLSCSAPSQEGGASDLNQLTLDAIGQMPRGGGYSGSDATKNKLPLACRYDGQTLRFSPQAARPSFCSGATYLVFLKALQSTQEISPALGKALVVAPNQKDGHGVFGRWNANGPGTAKLVADLNAGINFTSWEQARPGDVLKIWWNEHIGGQERGHLVIYLGHDAENVRFWSSNQPRGYGEKTVPRARCQRVLFTRITRPQNFIKATTLPARDPWLERMLRDDFSWNEVKKRCQVRD